MVETATTKVAQIGLWTTDKNEVTELAKRIAKFNDQWKTDITLDVEPSDADKYVTEKHLKLRIVFPSHEVQDKFWTE